MQKNITTIPQLRFSVYTSPIKKSKDEEHPDKYIELVHEENETPVVKNHPIIESTEFREILAESVVVLVPAVAPAAPMEVRKAPLMEIPTDAAAEK